MSMFASPEELHANPPESWRVEKKTDRVWHLVTRFGSPLSTFTTKRAAEAAKTSGFYFDLWHRDAAWYAGTSTDPRLRPYGTEKGEGPALTWSPDGAAQVAVSGMAYESYYSLSNFKVSSVSPLRWTVEWVSILGSTIAISPCAFGSEDLAKQAADAFERAHTIVMSLDMVNAYADEVVETTATDVRIPPPPADDDQDAYADWWGEHVMRFTGTGRSGDAYYKATITACSLPHLVGRTFESEG